MMLRSKDAKRQMWVCGYSMSSGNATIIPLEGAKKVADSKIYTQKCVPRNLKTNLHNTNVLVNRALLSCIAL